MIDDVGRYTLHFRTREEFDKFLLTCCTEEERHQILVRLGKQMVEGA